MKEAFTFSLLILLTVGCEDDTSSDGDIPSKDGDGEGIGLGDEDRDGDGDRDTDDPGDNSEAGTAGDNGDDAMLNYAVVQFCNQLDTPLMTRLDLSEGPYVSFFAATSSCCTICRKVSAGREIILALYDDERDLTREVVFLDDGGEYIIYAVDGDGWLFVEKLEDSTCDSTVPEGMAQCERP